MNETPPPNAAASSASTDVGAGSARAADTSRPTRFRSFAEFYPFYLSEHANRTSRRLHFVGTTGVIACVVAGFATGAAGWFYGAIVCGYGFAWVGHFFFERNRPATFRHPIYSFIGDWAMYRDVLRGRVRL